MTSKIRPTLTKSSKYTVLMSVYAKENPAYLQASLTSIFNQTVLPSEVLLLVDGPLNAPLEKVLEKYKKTYKSILNIVRFKKNRGLGLVLADGVNLAKFELIARMDSDDIAHPRRFEEQVKYLNQHSDCALVGSNVTEFIDRVDNIVASRIMPRDHDLISQYSRRRNPFAHPSVMFRKSIVLQAGNYRHYLYCEDYDLWVRMIRLGARCYNIQKNLVSMRTSKDFYRRRGGLVYLRSMIKFKYELLQSRYSTLTDFFVTAGSSTVVSLLPSGMRSLFYGKLLRSSYAKGGGR